MHPGNYFIVNSCFTNNNHTIPGEIHYQDHLSYGGGINIFLSWKANDNHFFIFNCTFDNNFSKSGGGAAVTIQEGASRNIVCFF